MSLIEKYFDDETFELDLSPKRFASGELELLIKELNNSDQYIQDSGKYYNLNGIKFISDKNIYYKNTAIHWELNKTSKIQNYVNTNFVKYFDYYINPNRIFKIDNHIQFGIDQISYIPRKTQYFAIKEDYINYNAFMIIDDTYYNPDYIEYIYNNKIVFNNGDERKITNITRIIEPFIKLDDIDLIIKRDEICNLSADKDHIIYEDKKIPVKNAPILLAYIFNKYNY